MVLPSLGLMLYFVIPRVPSESLLALQTHVHLIFASSSNRCADCHSACGCSRRCQHGHSSLTDQFQVSLTPLWLQINCLTSILQHEHENQSASRQQCRLDPHSHQQDGNESIRHLDLKVSRRGNIRQLHIPR
jgi:hypothetical protein